MPEARERKQSDKIKGGSKSDKKPVKNDVRRQMTAKLQKEFIERKKNSETGGDTGQTAEVQAANTVETEILTSADSIREHTGDAVSKSIAHYKRKIQDKKQHKEPPTGETPPVDTGPTPPPSQEIERQKAPGDIRMRPAESQREQPAPVKEYRPDKIRERPAAPVRGRERKSAETRGSVVSHRAAKAPVKERKAAEPQHTGQESAAAPRPSIKRTELPRPVTDYTASAPLSLKERMRQTAIKEKQDRHTGLRERPADPKERRITAPKYERTAPMLKAEPVPPKPQDRMREKAVADAKAQHREGKRSKPETSGIAPPPERPTAPKGAVESKPVSADSKSVTSIKERPRHSLALKEKPPGGSFIPKTRQSVGSGQSTVKAMSTAKREKAAARPLERMRQRIRQNAQKKLLQNSTRTSKAAADLSRKVFAAIAKGVSSAVSALAGLAGSSVLIPIICLIILVAAILASPFGILFSNEPTPGAVPLNVAVGSLNMALSNTLESLQTGDYDSFDVQGQGPDWREVVAVFAAKTAGADDGASVAVITPERMEQLRAIFWDMCIISTEVETIDHPDSDPNDGVDDSWTESILHITITAKTADDMRTEYAFTDYQNEALTELLAELAAMDILLTDLSISVEQARDLMRRLPDDLSPERRAAVETACRLVGKVSYFWGGKSLMIGWDSRWGTIQKVWATGSPTTGTYRPYGLDCSGFMDWIFYNISNGSYVLGHGGGAHAQHGYCQSITWDEAQPGDLVFYPEDTHVGIVGGWDDNGNILIIHCASGQNNVVITGKSGFTTIGRPRYYSA